MAPATYRKKPVEVQAVQWDGTPEGATPIIDWISELGGRAQFYGEIRGGGAGTETVPAIAIHTLEGSMSASPGDFVIRGVQGEFYPCKPDIFEATYDPVDT